MVNEGINAAEEQTENQSPAAETTGNQPSEASSGAAPEANNNQTTDAAQTSSAPETPAKQDFGGDEDFGAILEKFEQEQTAFHNGDFVQGKVIAISDRGVLIDFGYKSEGIAPTDDFTSPTGEMTIKKGDEVTVVIKDISAVDSPPTLSYSDARQQFAWDTTEKAYKDEEIIKGYVSGKTKGGLTVDINGIEAFLPGSLVDSRPVGNLEDFVGKEIEAKVIRFNRNRNNVVLSRKVLTDEIINEKKAETMSQIEEGFIVEGTITNLTEYGAFVDLGGIDGLLHITDMSWGRLNRASDVFKPEETVQVKILKLDREKEKISLGYKQLHPDPWEIVEELYPIGTRLKGKVTSVTEYGAFVELEPGIEGLVHVSEMSWSKRTKQPKNLVKRNEEIEVQVLGIDPQERRISLGMKQLQPNPWDEFMSTFQVGDKVRGQVRSLTDFGAFVEVIEGVEGLVHLSDISWSRKIKHPKDVLTRGQDVDAIITKINSEARKISLSIKELSPSAWETFVATHKPGDVVRGKISRFTNFGVFVELAEELEGLCHISELSEDRIDDPKKHFEIGQELEFKILRIEPDDQKIGLSHRAVGKEDEPVTDTKAYSSGAKGGMASLGELANLKFGAKTAEAKEEPKAESKKEKNQAETEQETGSETQSEAGSETQAAPTETGGESSTADTTGEPAEEESPEPDSATSGEAVSMTAEATEENAPAGEHAETSTDTGAEETETVSGTDSEENAPSAESAEPQEAGEPTENASETEGETTGEAELQSPATEQGIEDSPENAPAEETAAADPAAEENANDESERGEIGKTAEETDQAGEKSA